MEKSKFTEEQIFVLHENFPAGNGENKGRQNATGNWVGLYQSGRYSGLNRIFAAAHLLQCRASAVLTNRAGSLYQRKNQRGFGKNREVNYV